MDIFYAVWICRQTWAWLLLFVLFIYLITIHRMVVLHRWLRRPWIYDFTASLEEGHDVLHFTAVKRLKLPIVQYNAFHIYHCCDCQISWTFDQWSYLEVRPLTKLIHKLQKPYLSLVILWMVVPRVSILSQKSDRPYRIPFSLTNQIKIQE